MVGRQEAGIKNEEQVYNFFKNVLKNAWREDTKRKAKKNLG